MATIILFLILGLMLMLRVPSDKKKKEEPF
jgi:MFS-type transporter involved in bile tolerance (Atg22 family)